MNYFDRQPDSDANVAASGASTQPGEARADATLDAFLDIADALQERVSAALGQVGLSYPKYEVLAMLRDGSGQCSLGALAAGQKCARSNITQIVDRLEADGLVQRIPDPSDRRGVLAEITPAGEELLVAGAAQLDSVRAEFADSLSDADRALVRRLLAWVQ